MQNPQPGVARRSGRLRATFFGAIVSLTDLLPPRLRYGYVHRLTAALLRRPLPALRPLAASSPAAPRTSRRRREQPILTCALATGDLDVGGIGPVVEMLAQGFEDLGIRTVVICLGDGVRARRLRASAIEVRTVASPEQANAALHGVEVIALHSAPEFLERAAMETDVPLVTAMHNTEIHFTRRRWKTFAALVERSASGIAVSETVRAFHARHVGDRLAGRFVVVPNGAPVPPQSDPERREMARAALGAVLRTNLADTDVVFTCLARYDSQKNVAGTVASFLHAVDTGLVRAHFVYAGEPSDWAEYWRADGIRLSSPHADRVHLLANSDADTLLAAADVFLLNSFFEGWPVAATEAAAAGLPLILSEVGGAAELVSCAPDRSVLIANAAGDAAAVSDSRVRAARRRSRLQSNCFELSATLRTVAEQVRGDRTRVVPPHLVESASTMVKQHAAVVLRSARTHAQMEEI